MANDERQGYYEVRCMTVQQLAEAAVDPETPALLREEIDAEVRRLGIGEEFAERKRAVLNALVQQHALALRMGLRRWRPSMPAVESGHADFMSMLLRSVERHGITHSVGWWLDNDSEVDA